MSRSVGYVKVPDTEATQLDDTQSFELEPSVSEDVSPARGWSAQKRWSTIILVAIISSLTPLASTMLAPLLGQIMDTLAVKSDVAATAILTSYVLGFCFGPLLFAPMSEVYGRLVVYRVCTVGFLVFTVACAAAPDIALLCVFRFLAGSFGSPPQAVAGATVADVMDQSERGKAMAVVTLLTLAAPALGPVCGGFIGARWGWRAALWIVAILTAVAAIFTLFMKETYGPLIAAKSLNKEAGQSARKAGLRLSKDSLRTGLTSIQNPLKALPLSWSLVLASTVTAVANAYVMLLLSTFSSVFKQSYDFDLTQIGQVYLALGVGGGIGILATGWLSDAINSNHLSKGRAIVPEIRLKPATICVAIMPIGLCLYGWTAQYKVSWIATAAGSMIFSAGCYGSQLAIRSYIVDRYQTLSASALAVNLILRSLVTAILPLGGRSLDKAIGVGWASSLLAISVALLLPIPILLARKRLYDAICTLPANVNFDVSQKSEIHFTDNTGLSQDLESHGLAAHVGESASSTQDKDNLSELLEPPDTPATSFAKDSARG